MNKKIKIGLLIIGIGILLGGGIFLYMFFQPHRDVQSAKTDFQLEAKQIVDEYLKDSSIANNKYLQEEGDSKIIEVSGIVAEITEDFNQQKVVLLKGMDEPAGVSCTFTSETNKNANKLKIGDRVIIKGVIRSGAGYDKDMELYEDVIMEKCDLVKSK